MRRDSCALEVSFPSLLVSETDQVDGGKGGQDDHAGAVLGARRHEALALRYGEPRNDGGDAQAEVREDVEHRQDPGSLIGAGKRRDEADGALETRAESHS